MKLVLVKWLDIVAAIGWENKEETFESDDPLKADTCLTVGWIIKETPDCLFLAGTFSEDETNSRSAIPTGVILKIEELQVQDTSVSLP